MTRHAQATDRRSATNSAKSVRVRRAPRAGCRQSGYLMEIPLMMGAVGVMLAILLPVLPKGFGKILLAAGALVWIACLYYILLAHGWLPGEMQRRGLTLRIGAFLGLALLIAAVAGTYVLFG